MLNIFCCLCTRMYEEIVEELHPDINEQDIAAQVDENFATWFENYVSVRNFLLLIIYIFLLFIIDF